MENNTFIYVDINELIPYANNARTHSEEQIQLIRSSLREFGFINPVIIDNENGIIAGHGRVIAARREGITKIPCVKVDHLTEAQKKAYILADNRLAELSEWDEEMLRIEIEQLNNLDFDVDLLGFDLTEYFTEDINEEELSEEDEYNEPLPEEPISKLGDIYQLGEHRLMCGDSTNADNVQALMGGVLADMLITDPPYNVDYHGGTSERLTIKNDKQGDTQFRAFLADAFNCADKFMKPGAVFYIWHADSEGFNFRAACRECGWTVRQCLIWKKSSLVIGRQDYQWQHEPCLYGWKDGAGHLWASDRKQTTILEFDKPKKNDVHPTMKPVKLFDYQIRNNTKEKDVVLDLFGGSGTSIIACEQNGRICYTMELDPRYVDVIIDRWEKLTGEKAVLLNRESEAPDEA